jgi:hypothetical protein
MLRETLALVVTLASSTIPTTWSVADCRPAGANTGGGAVMAAGSCCVGNGGACGCRGSRVLCCNGTLDRNCACAGDDSKSTPTDVGSAS